MDLGLKEEELDPIWYEAMLRMKSAMEQERANSTKRGGKRPHG